jgi:hypothetical protein
MLLMADHIERVIEDVLRYRAATQGLIEALQRQTESSDEDINVMRSGITMAEKMRRAGSSELSRNLTQRLEEFEAVRRDVRWSITRALVAEGLSTPEIGDMFGVSRQLASRFVNDAPE